MKTLSLYVIVFTPAGDVARRKALISANVRQANIGRAERPQGR